MTRDEREQLEVLLRKQLREQRETVRNRQDCPDADLMSAYLEDGLSALLKTRLESHVSECRQCQEELAFLLKTFPPEITQNTKEIRAPGQTIGKWFGLAWIKPAFLKPAFALLAVAVVGGVLGYKIIFEHDSAKDTATQIADSMARLPEPPESRLEKTEDRKASAEVGTGLPANSNQQSDAGVLTAEKPRPNASPGTVTEGKSISSPLEPRSPLPKEAAQSGNLATYQGGTNESSKQKERREDLGEESEASRQVAEVPPSSSPATIQLSDRERMKQDSGIKEQQEVKDKKVAGAPTTEKEVAAQLGAADATSRSALGSKRKLAMKDEVTNATKAEESGGDGSPTGESKNLPVLHPHRLRLDGKTFELRDNVWVDLSIGKEQDYTPLIIRKGTKEYHDLEKELSGYQDVLNRPEDCLIKLGDHIYRIQKK